MSKVLEIREVCGDYALDVEYSKDYTFTMFFNSRRNAETVKRCIEVDDSIPNVATAVDFVEVVRCKDCKYAEHWHNDELDCRCPNAPWSSDEYAILINKNDYCSYGERKEENEG